MRRSLFILIGLLVCSMGVAQKRKVQNRPYIDQRLLHYGFFVGLHTQDLEFNNNGLITEEGETWFADVADYSPGFSVGVLAEAYMTSNVSVRLIPSLYFGQKNIIFYEQQTHKEYHQVMKSTLLAVPLNMKFSAPRFNNHRPFVVAGVNPTLSLSNKDRKALLLKEWDCYMEVGLGCDFYLPFFKLIPELKFCFGLRDILEKNRPDLIDKSLLKYTQLIDSATDKMVMLTFYFE
ncbi:MAG: PorT family protein [Bacteroidaceae bacterium]|nr:PorT family protein [Bacteroidaceae bacterium]